MSIIPLILRLYAVGIALTGALKGLFGVYPDALSAALFAAVMYWTATRLDK